MSECFVERDSVWSDVRIGKYYRISDGHHAHNGKVGKCVDITYTNGFYKMVTIKLYNGDHYALSSEQLVSIGDDAKDLLDSDTSHSHEAARELVAAHENRVQGYKRHSARQIKKMQAAEKVSTIMDKMSRQKEELQAVENGTWYRDYWEPDYTKIGVTAGVQLANVIQLITLMMTGGAFAPLGVIVFLGVLAGNYQVLKNWKYDEK